eukprot:444082-Karenia_brevis.AAC.1
MDVSHIPTSCKRAIARGTTLAAAAEPNHPSVSDRSRRARASSSRSLPILTEARGGGQRRSAIQNSFNPRNQKKRPMALRRVIAPVRQGGSIISRTSQGPPGDSGVRKTHSAES